MLLASLPYTQSVLAAAVAEKDNSSVSKVDIPVTQGGFSFLIIVIISFSASDFHWAFDLHCHSRVIFRQ